MVTFLFSDIEGSTQRWESNPAAMDSAVKRHDALLRDAVTRHNGYTFKTIGDAFCVAFARVSEAVAAAIDAQHTLSAEQFSAVGGLTVRMGLHVGESSEREGDYFGPAVNRAARLMSIGHGGQILLSRVTRDLAHGELPSGASLVDLGSHRLKDLMEPEQVWQLNISGLPAEFPPLRSLDTLPNNLPVQRTTLVGREHDVREVKDLIAQHRLLTLVGAGGVGKTRLALQVGAELLERYPDGVWLADFAPISDPELVSSVLAKALGMSQVEGPRVSQSIPPWLKHKKLLLVLDNCEHVLDVVAPIADAILETATDVRLLATSRQALGVAGEEVVRLASLDVPLKSVELAPAAAIEFGAVALFVDRAKSVQKSFALTGDNAPVVAEICRRLDGIPLAIELAAARVKVLSLPHLAERLNERFKILTGGSRTSLPRQKTLAALIDWSYDLLSSHEQVLFQRLGIFAGGFSLNAATAVCSDESLADHAILDHLTSLVDKSLIVAETLGANERFGLLESTREYALEKLVAAGEGESMARIHARHFLATAQDADDAMRTTTRAAYLAALEPELDNLRAALEWSLGRTNDVLLGAALAGSLLNLWYHGGLHAEGRRWLEQGLAVIDEGAQPKIAGALWKALAFLTSGKRQLEAGERARKLCRSVADRRGEAWALMMSAYALKQMGRAEEATDYNSQASALMRDTGDMQGTAVCLTLEAGILWPLGEVEASRDVYTRAIAAFRALGDKQGVALPLNNLAELEFVQGNAELALRYATEVRGLDVDRKPSNATVTYCDIAAYRTALGDVDGATQSARLALRSAQRAQNPALLAAVATHLALCAALSGDPTTAARLGGYSAAKFEELELQLEAAEKWSYEKLVTVLHERIGKDESLKLAAEGASWSENHAVEEALKI